MPNWCYNTLAITGKQEDLNKFKKFVGSKKNPFDFEKIIPYPKEYREQDKKAQEWRKKADSFAKKHKQKEWYCGDGLTEEQRAEFIKKNGDEPKDGFNQGGYEWCSSTWGTKWNSCEPTLSESEGILNYSFDTAWAPPIPVIEKAGEMFKQLNFGLYYCEEGCGFAGDLEILNGEIINHEQRNVESVQCEECEEYATSEEEGFEDYRKEGSKMLCKECRKDDLAELIEETIIKEKKK